MVSWGHYVLSVVIHEVAHERRAEPLERLLLEVKPNKSRTGSYSHTCTYLVTLNYDVIGATSISSCMYMGRLVKD